MQPANGMNMENETNASESNECTNLLIKEEVGIRTDAHFLFLRTALSGL